MAEIIQIHYLTSYAPCNLNRDDQGRPKTAPLGGVERLRVSSQCLKRTWRKSDVFSEVSEQGIRSKNHGQTIFDHLTSNGASDVEATKITRAIISVIGKLKVDDKNLSKNPEKALSCATLLYLTPTEIERANTVAMDIYNNPSNYAETAKKGKKVITVMDDDTGKEKIDAKKIKADSIYDNTTLTADVALFGRMLTSAPAFNVSGTINVANAITIGRGVVENDYFTAVDELCADEDTGAGHLDSTQFGSGIFYGYIIINKTELVDMIGEEDADKAIKALITACATVSPEGKKTTFASSAFASYMLVEKGSREPCQLSDAFFRPVEGGDAMNIAIERIRNYRANQETTFCAPRADKYSEFICTCERQEGTINDLIEIVGE